MTSSFFVCESNTEILFYFQRGVQTSAEKRNINIQVTLFYFVALPPKGSRQTNNGQADRRGRAAAPLFFFLLKKSYGKSVILTPEKFHPYKG